MSAAVYVDFDDVLSETARALAAVSEREFGRHTAFEDIHTFDLSVSFGLNEAQTARLFELFHDGDILMDIVPVSGAVEGVRAWHDAGATIHIVTGRPPSTHAVSQAWLALHNVPYERLTFVDKFDRGHAHVPGVDILTRDELRECSFCMAIDDSPQAIRFLADHTRVPIIIFDRPWNESLGTLGDDARILRCETWAHVLEQVPNPTTWQGDNR